MENEAFRGLFDVTYPDVMRFVRSMIANQADAEEIVQDIYVKVANCYHGYRGDASIKTWVLSIARNAVIDFLRLQQRRQRQQEAAETLAVWTAQDVSVEQTVLQREDVMRLRQCVDRLPVPMRIVFVCRAVHELSNAETAAVMNWNTGRVRVTYSRALFRLRKLWAEEGTSEIGKNSIRTSHPAVCAWTDDITSSEGDVHDRPVS